MEKTKKFSKYYIIIFFVDNIDKFIIKNYSSIIYLITFGQINQLFPIFIYTKEPIIQNEKDKIESSLNYYKLQLNFVNDMGILIDAIKSSIQNKTLHDEYIDIIKNEMFYISLIRGYRELFYKSIYSDEIEDDYKNKLIFMKISQDIQFYQNFDFDGNIPLNEDTKNDYNNIINREDIQKLVNNFIDETKMINEINDILLEFEEQINQKSNAIKKNKENKQNINGNDGEKNVENKINTFNNNKANQPVDSKENKSEIITIKNINSGSKEKINECEKILCKAKKEIGSKTSKDDKDDRKSDNSDFLVLKELIRVNIINKIKNQIPYIIYMIFQDNIVQYYEKKFIQLNK